MDKLFELRNTLKVQEHPVKSIVRCAFSGNPVMYVVGELRFLERFLCACMGVVVVYA